MNTEAPFNNPLRRMLKDRARQPAEGPVYVTGGWVERRSTVPTDGGVEAVVRFADECWRKNIDLQRQLLELQFPRKDPTDATEI